MGKLHFNRKYKNCDESKNAKFSQRLMRRYGIDAAEYHRLLKYQKSKCALCDQSTGWLNHRKRLHVDHDHDTKRIRGLLCSGCNQFVGAFQKRISKLDKILAYLFHPECFKP